VNPCCTKALTRKRPIPGGAVVHDGAHQTGALLGTQRTIGLRADLAVDLDRGRKAGGDEQIRSLFFDHSPKQILHQAYSLFPLH
jgi:hypothetical protein